MISFASHEKDWMKENSYKKLAGHLDKLQGGFSFSGTSAELRLLQRLFTQHEAALAVHLTLKREEAGVIAARAGLALAETEKRLDEMSGKGLIFSVQPADGPVLYQAVPFDSGIYEFQVNNLDEGLVKDLSDYWENREKRPGEQHIPLMRTIPVGESIEPNLEVFPYEQVDELLKANDRFAVAPCICRRYAGMTGEGCDAPEESCLIFGDWADYYVRDGRGRAIDRSGVKEILDKADAADLVLQPNNSKDISILCCCCGCCCGVLKRLRDHPKPSEIVSSPFFVTLDVSTCLGCGVCVKRCRMQAIAENIDKIVLDTDRCIGCGLCVSTCPSGALTLARKSGKKQMHPPITMEAAWRKIAQL